MTDTNLTNEQLLRHMCAHWYLYIDDIDNRDALQYKEHYDNYLAEALRRMEAYTATTKEPT